MQLLAIDPGDTYVGVARFIEDAGNRWGWRCAAVAEYGADQFCDFLAIDLAARQIDIVVYERFRLYADKAMQQTGSEFLTSQMIGVIKWLVSHTTLRDDRWQPPLLVAQLADIKQPTAGILRRRGIKSMAKPVSRELYEGRDHVVDAELHGWHWIFNNQADVAEGVAP